LCLSILLPNAFSLYRTKGGGKTQNAAMKISHVPKSDLEILNQEIDPDDVSGIYRIRAGRRVHYLNIEGNVFDKDTLCRPYLLIPNLPDFPDSDWTKMEIRRKEDGSLATKISWDALEAVGAVWHPNIVEVLSLPKIKNYKPSVNEVLYCGRPAICKIARFEWNIPRMDNETRVYSVIEEYRHDWIAVAPAFLGHVAENGRVMGILLEKLNGDFASIDDLVVCEKTISTLHAMNVIHGDPNRYNFMIDRVKGDVRLMDFEHAEPYEAAKAPEELQSLWSELEETTGRGSVINWKSE